MPQDAYDGAIANVDDEDMPVLAMLLDGAPLDAIAHALRTDQAEISWRAQRIRQNMVRDSRHLTEIDGPVLAVAVAERLAGERAERHLELVRRVRDAALGAGRGALGLADVLAALNGARVEP